MLTKLLEYFSMDGSSTLVLEGSSDNLPQLAVNDSATVAGALVLRTSLPPNFSSFGVRQNFTIVTCGLQCQGGFQDIKVELVDDCVTVEEAEEVRPRDGLLAVAVVFSKPAVCLAPAFLPSVIMLVILFIVH